MKKIVSMILCMMFLFSGNVSAYTFPKGFFDLNNKYIAAADAKDYRGMINYGSQLIKMMRNEPECTEKENVLISRYNGVANAYEALGDYASAANIYKEFYAYAIKFGDKYYDYTRPSYDKALQYTPQIKIMTDDGEGVFYGAKNERKDGVLFGLNSDSPSNDEINNQSALILYQELGHEITGYSHQIMSNAQEKGIAVEFALNCKGEGADINNIHAFDGSFAEVSAFLSEYQSVPVYLRFAAEFDVWGVKCEPDAFKSAFRYVSQYFKSRNSNVAMVWSMTPSPSYGVDTNDFYPGDEYVDWVGTTLYSQKYFVANSNSSALNNVLFKCGNSSDPVLAIRDIVEKYGSKKPIMISESGSGHTVMSSGENTADFAEVRIKQMMYYVPMVYPQVKFMAYFDRYIEGSGEKSDYRLSTNGTLKAEYKKAVSGFRFVQDSFSGMANTSAFREIAAKTAVDRVFPIYCYAHKFGTEVKSVTYFVDGVYAASSNEIPFESYIDATKLKGSVHKVKAAVLFADGTTMEKESEISLLGAVSDDISVEISGRKTEFDSAPVIYKSRTIVPMRKIFEELGADVSWDGETRTITAVKDGKNIRITVGSRFMYVDGEKIELDVPPVIIGGRTLVPARAVSEALGCSVSWNGDTKTVEIEIA